MEPDLHDQDLILINHADEALNHGDIYAIRYSDRLFVKRIQQAFGGKIQLLSSNKSYPPIEVQYPGINDLSVIGRVVASMHEW